MWDMKWVMVMGVGLDPELSKVVCALGSGYLGYLGVDIRNAIGWLIPHQLLRLSLTHFAYFNMLMSTACPSSSDSTFETPRGCVCVWGQRGNCSPQFRTVSPFVFNEDAYVVSPPARCYTCLFNGFLSSGLVTRMVSNILWHRTSS